MDSKWEFILELLEELKEKYIVDKRMDEAIDLAKSIDASITNLYGLVHTDSWVEFMNNDNIDTTDILSLVNWITCNQDFCSACVIEKYKCEECKFADMHGDCDRDGSMFFKFLNILNEIIDDVDSDD